METIMSAQQALPADARSARAAEAQAGMGRREELTDEQWAIIKPLIPHVARRQDGRGRPWRDNREVLAGDTVNIA